jgi:hypothetical protein
VAAAAAVLATVVVSGSVRAQPGGHPEAAPEQFTPVIASLQALPRPVLGADRQRHLPYELLLLNPNSVPVRIDKIETLEPRRGGRVLATLAGQALAAVMRKLDGSPGRTLGPSQAGFVIMDLARVPSAPLPRTLSHRLTIAQTDQPFVTGRTRVVREVSPLVGPPLPGPRWLDVSGCCAAAATSHRTALNAINGALHLAQRFAIDFVRLSPGRRLYTGPPDQLSSYPGYGRAVRSATPGVVVRTQDGLVEQVPFQPPADLPAHEYPGNYIVVAFGDDRYAGYGHLQPGSLRVEVGDQVRAGQVLALLGNSGNTDLPHLHFQVTDSRSFLAADGRPYRFRFSSRGLLANPDQLIAGAPAEFADALSGAHPGRLPLDLQSVDFPRRH